LRFGFGTDASPSDISAFNERFGCPIVEGYGSSEGAISMSRVPGTPRQAMGVPPPGTEVAIVDPRSPASSVRPARIDDGGRLLNAAEAIGEIVSRNGAQRFEGYYANEEAEAERTRGGWFWSGDLGYRDEAGFFYFAGRPADWLRVDGENFAAAPVERILARFPVSSPRPSTRSPIRAPGTRSWPRWSWPRGPVRSRRLRPVPGHQEDLGTKWAPRFVRLVDQIPLTGTNKVDKRPLRSRPGSPTDPVWWRPFVGRGAEGTESSYRLLTTADVDASARSSSPPTAAPACLNSDPWTTNSGRWTTELPFGRDSRLTIHPGRGDPSGGAGGHEGPDARPPSQLRSTTRATSRRVWVPLMTTVHVVDDGPEHCMIGRPVGALPTGASTSSWPASRYGYEQLRDGDVELAQAFSDVARHLSVRRLRGRRDGREHRPRPSLPPWPPTFPSEYLPPSPFLEFSDEDSPTDDFEADESVTDDAVTGDAVTGDAVTGDAVTGDAVADDAVGDDAVRDDAADDGSVDDEDAPTGEPFLIDEDSLTDERGSGGFVRRAIATVTGSSRRRQHRTKT
jgi:hypothetical protein